MFLLTHTMSIGTRFVFITNSFTLVWGAEHMRFSVTPKRTGVFLAITRPNPVSFMVDRSIEDVVPDVAPLTNNSHLYCFTLFIGRTLSTARKILLECLPFQ